jgi:hypothetical protein
MQLFFFGQQLVDRLLIHLVRDAAIHRTYGSTLGFFVKALAFRAFIWNDIIRIYADGGVAFGGVYYGAVEQREGSFYAGSVCDCPFYAAFVDRIIGTLWFAGAAIDAFFSYLNSHFFKN